jgi:two-component system chemotaxis response regulator CheB
MKKILVVDDSALMRSVLCDIISSDPRFQVGDRARDGLEALALLQQKKYDAVVLDVNMPRMDGLQLLRELQKQGIHVKVMMASTYTSEGAKTTLDALELGAVDFIHKPDNVVECRNGAFQQKFLGILWTVAESRSIEPENTFNSKSYQSIMEVSKIAARHSAQIKGSKVIALASSTGGPKALQSVVPRLPKNLNAPMVLVQHMPAGFTKSLAERLDSLGDITVTEAQEGDVLEKGHVYIAMGGKHMNVVTERGRCHIHYTDEPTREGVKPCANYMFESLEDSPFDEVLCVVMTGMGCDGTEGIENLKKSRKTHVIAQEESTCAVYGMPRSIVQKNLADQVVKLDAIAEEIVMNVGVG